MEEHANTPGMGIIQNNIKTIRKKLGYTQETVADVLGIARSTYTEYETKDIEIPLNTLEKLSDFFGVELSSFFSESCLIRCSTSR